MPATAPSSRTLIYVLIGVLSALVLGGVIVGMVFLVRGCSGNQAVEDDDKYVTEALRQIEKVDEIEGDLIAETRGLDFSVGAEQFQVQVKSIQKQLGDATVKLDAAAASLEKIDVTDLPDWWDTYISLLDKAYAEKRKAYQEWDEFITRMAELDEFSQTYTAMVNAYNAALNTLSSAISQHNAEQYAAARSTSASAQGQLAQASTQLQALTQLEPGVDLSQVSAAISQVWGFISEFQRLCDLALAGSWDQHNALVDQLRPQFDSLPRTISFDINAWIASIRDEYVDSIEDHLAREADYRARAAEVWEENND
ncbi:MAG: hypothetical protein AB1384_15085 [Actinomycetota bacterium]